MRVAITGNEKYANQSRKCFPGVYATNRYEDVRFRYSCCPLLASGTKSAIENVRCADTNFAQRKNSYEDRNL